MGSSADTAPMSQPAPDHAPPFAPAPSFAAPAAPPAPGEHPPSLAMPVLEARPQPVMQAQPQPLADQYPTAAAMPSFASIIEAAPMQIGGVPAATPADLADLAGAGPAARTSDPHAVDPTGTWWSPGVALVLAFAALAVQLVSFYVREQLPVLETTGQELDNFDQMFSSMPIVGSSLGPVLGALLAAGAMVIVFYGSRRGLREPTLQVVVSAVAALSLIALVVLPRVV